MIDDDDAETLGARTLYQPCQSKHDVEAGYDYLVPVHDRCLPGVYLPQGTARALLDDQQTRRLQEVQVERQLADDNQKRREEANASWAKAGTTSSSAQGAIPTTGLQAADAVPPSGHHRIWCPSELAARVARHNARSTPDPELRKRDDTVLREMIDRGPDREVRGNPAMDRLLGDLSLDFGGFERALESVCGWTAARTRPQPLLIVGPPGIGKTRFVQALAEALGLPFEKVNLASGVNATALTGAQRNWANTEVGLVFRLLVQHRDACANPAIMLDELDKATNDSRHYPVLPALLGLLEPENARRFRDLSLEVELDASMINWIATANSIKGIARPLLSRFRVVVPTEPTVRQRLHVSQEIAKRVAKSYEIRAVPREIVVALADRTPREIRMALEAAAGKVLGAGRSLMVEHDVVELGTAAGQAGRRLAVQVH